jgi:hypothetical protein
MPLRGVIEGRGAAEDVCADVHESRFAWYSGDCCAAHVEPAGLELQCASSQRCEWLSDRFTCERVEVRIQNNDAARAAAAKQLAVAVLNVRFLWIEVAPYDYDGGLHPRALLEMLSVLSDATFAAPGSSSSRPHHLGMALCLGEWSGRSTWGSRHLALRPTIGMMSSTSICRLSCVMRRCRHSQLHCPTCDGCDWVVWYDLHLLQHWYRATRHRMAYPARARV